MSHAHGAVKFTDGTILYCEYNGTVDVMLPFLYDTPEEVQANWRRRDWKFHTLECNGVEQVTIFTTYGAGFSWQGRACKECKVIVDNHSPDYNTEERGIPDWYPMAEGERKYWKGI